MTIVLQLLFAAVLGYAGWRAAQRVQFIRRNILLGKAEDRSDQPMARLAVMARVALGQGKMFDRPLAAVMHLFIYVGFVVINLELLEIVLDGLLGKLPEKSNHPLTIMFSIGGAGAQKEIALHAINSLKNEIKNRKLRYHDLRR